MGAQGALATLAVVMHARNIRFLDDRPCRGQFNLASCAEMVSSVFGESLEKPNELRLTEYWKVPLQLRFR